jgi:hypothetical protein
VILPSQALHQHCRHFLPAVSYDFALRGANFAGIGADFARVYPRPLYKKALAAPLSTLPSAESAVMALKQGIATAALSQTKKPAPGMLDHSGRLSCSNRLHLCFARVSLDDEVDLTFKFKRLSRDFLHQLHRTKARIGSHQQSPKDKNCGHWQGALKVVFSLRGQMLIARAQGQFHAIAQDIQVHGIRAVAVNSGVSATNQFFLCAPEGWIYKRIKIDALEIFSDEGQTDVGAEVLGRLINNQFGHDVPHLKGVQNF